MNSAREVERPHGDELTRVASLFDHMGSTCEVPTRILQGFMDHLRKAEQEHLKLVCAVEALTKRSEESNASILRQLEAERKELAGEREALKAQYAATTEVAKALNMARTGAMEAIEELRTECVQAERVMCQLREHLPVGGNFTAAPCSSLALQSLSRVEEELPISEGGEGEDPAPVREVDEVPGSTGETTIEEPSSAQLDAGWRLVAAPTPILPTELETHSSATGTGDGHLRREHAAAAAQAEAPASSAAKVLNPPANRRVVVPARTGKASTQDLHTKVSKSPERGRARPNMVKAPADQPVKRGDVRISQKPRGS